MKRLVCAIVLTLLFSATGRAQSDQDQNQRPTLGSSPQQDQDNQRPTLGPRNGPGLDSGPDLSTVTDVRKLMRIHTLYIESIDNALSDRLVEVLGKTGRFRLVTKPKEADATLRGSCLESRRLKHVHSEIFISDRAGASVWQDTIVRPFNPPTLDKAVNETATLIAAHLEKTMRAAQH